MKKTFIGLIALLLSPIIVSAIQITVPSSTQYGQVLIGNAVGGSYTPVATSTLGISGSSGGTGNVATSSAETANDVPFWTSTNGTPARLSGGVSGFTWNPITSVLTTTNASTTNTSVSGNLYTEFLLDPTGDTITYNNLQLTPTAGMNLGTPMNPWAKFQATTGTIVNASTTNITASNEGFFKISSSTNSTSNNATTTTQYITGIKSSLLSTDANGQVVGTSTIGNNQLQNNSIIVTTAAPLGGAATVPLGGTLALTCATCSTTSGTVTSVTAASPNSTLTLGGTNPVTSSGTINFDLNLAHSNWWTAVQDFTNATTSIINSTSSAFLATTNGTVNIGTTTPQSGFILNVAGGSGFQTPVLINGLGSNGPFINFQKGSISKGYFGYSNTGTGGFGWINGAGTTQNLSLTDAGSLGIASTTPGSILSIGVSGNAAGINFSLATSTFANAGGINITTGCYAINGTCIGNGSGISTPVSIANGGTATTTQVSHGINYFDSTRITSNPSLTFDGTNVTVPAQIFSNSIGSFPSYSWVGLSNTGFGLDSINNPYISANGAQALTVNYTTANVGIGTTTPPAPFSVQSASSTLAFNPVFDIWSIINAVEYLFERIDEWGHLITSGPAPSLSSCGTSTVAGNDRNGTITLVGVALTSCTMTFAHAYAAAPDCTVSDNTTASVADVDSTASKMTIGLSVGLNSGKVFYQCAQHQ